MDEIIGEKGCCHTPRGIEDLPSMNKLIKEIKEKLQILVDYYNVQDISVYIDDSKSDILRDKKEVYVEVIL